MWAPAPPQLSIQLLPGHMVLEIHAPGVHAVEITGTGGYGKKKYSLIFFNPTLRTYIFFKNHRTEWVNTQGLAHGVSPWGWHMGLAYGVNHYG